MRQSSIRCSRAFCTHHGTLAKPAAVYSPTHKAKVEIGVKLVQRVLRLALNGRPLLRLAAMNALLIELVERLNHKPLRRAKGEIRHSLYQTLDLPVLRPLRQDTFLFHEVRRGLMLGPDYHLAHDQCRYSAPHTLIGRKLDLRPQMRRRPAAVHAVDGSPHRAPKRTRPRRDHERRRLKRASACALSLTPCFEAWRKGRGNRLEA